MSKILDSIFKACFLINGVLLFTLKVPDKKIQYYLYLAGIFNLIVFSVLQDINNRRIT